jgi:hypothetical protein
MKPETLIKRYENLGYEPKNLPINLEISSIIEWIYQKHDIYIDVWYSNMDFGKNFTPRVVTKSRFQGFAQWETTKEYSSRFSCDNYFKNPFDAKYDAVRYFYRSIKFKYH